MALNNELDNLINQLNAAGVSTSKFSDRIAEARTNQDALVRLVSEMNQALADTDGTASNLFSRLISVTAELGKNNSALNLAKGSYSKIRNISQKLAEDEAGIGDLNKQQVSRLLEQAKAKQKLLGLSLEQLTPEEKLSTAGTALLKANEEGNKEIQETIDKAEARLKQEKRISKQMGVTGAVVGGTGALMERLGMRSGIFKDAVEDAQESMRNTAKQADILGKKASKISIAFIGINKLAKGFGEALIDPAVIGGKLLDVFFKINEQSVKLQRLTGQVGSSFDTSIGSAASMVDQIEVAAELTSQMGFSAQNAFSRQNLSGAANLKVEMGLAADEAGNIALMAQTSNRNVEELTDSIVASTSEFNGTNRTAIAQGVILRDIGKVSQGIRASFAGNTKELVNSAAAARRLGMEIGELDTIANSLLDFESSIGNELEAQLLTGNNINLAKARELALTNDLAGLGKELFENSSSLAEFGQMNRIQQEAQAKALGMTRDQLAKVAYQRAVQLKMTDEEIKKATGVEASDMRRIEAQKNFTKALEKVAAAIAPILDKVGSFLSIPWVPQILIGVVGVVKLVKAFKSFTLLQSLAAKKFDILNAKQAIFGKMYKGGQFMPGGGRAKAGGQRAGGILSTLFGKKGTDSIPKGAGETGGKGISGISNAISKIDMKKVLQGAAALAIVAGAVFIFGKAVQQFMEVSWSDLGKAIVGMFALVGAVGAIGAIMMSGVGAVAILAGAAAMLVMAGAVLVLGYGVQALATGFNMMIPNLINLSSMAPQLLLVGGALMSIAAGLGSIAVAGLAAIPALAALSGFALMATPLIALGGLFGDGGEDSDGFAKLEAKLDTLIEVISSGGDVYLDSDKVGRTHAKSFSKLTGS